MAMRVQTPRVMGAAGLAAVVAALLVGSAPVGGQETASRGGSSNTSEIVQGPEYVAIRYEMIHDVRVIPLDGRPAIPPAMRQYFGDSRGRWDGDTLVVEVANFPAHMVNYRGATEGLRLVERFRRTAANTVHYEVTVTDAATFSRPWTAALDLRTSSRVSDVFEYACHEGNYAMRNILNAAREAERAAAGRP